jgi:ATP adenylyltransferase
MEYIRTAHKTCAGSNCLFCRLRRSKNDDKDLILSRTELGMVVMNRYPYNNGHLMVAPNRHVAEPEQLSDKETLELVRLIQKSLAVLRAELSPKGFNVGMNLGRVAGAGVFGHLHVHIVPRWLGDANYMPLIGETKVISEHLSETYRRLKRRFQRRR